MIMTSNYSNSNSNDIFIKQLYNESEKAKKDLLDFINGLTKEELNVLRKKIL